MLAEVPRADVVIVNPTHFAVALRWDRAALGAPVCVAKGEGELARRIRARAEEAGVPIRRDPPTARALFAAVAVGESIREEHFRAVAAAIRFADAMRKRAALRAWP
jgi:flagellar biosynthetic protein FlhB